MPSAPGIPDAWPQLLSRDQLCAYLGGLSWDTVKRILPVAPLDLGANVLRYRRPDIDAWLDRCPLKGPRLPRGETSAHDAAPSPGETDEAPIGEDLRVVAMDRVRRRALKGGSGCQRTA